METFHTGTLGGWLRAGDPDRQVLLLHGGPGLTDYMDELLPELDGWTVASFQQRGLAPSATEGTYTHAEALADVDEVLDHLGWTRPYVVGHSWGGYLGWKLAAYRHHRLAGVIVVDPVGAVGDKGLPEWSAAFERLVDPALAARAAATEDPKEALALYWPYYFADPASAPPAPDWEQAPQAAEGAWPEMLEPEPDLEEALTRVPIPVYAVHGAGGPMPLRASLETLALIPDSWCDAVDGAGHFVWREAPGRVGAALDRVAAAGTGVTGRPEGTPG
ncbi:MAG: alpha/beta hydrolase [Nocardioides sp.]|uniref:alpha/beta fold hydrolase n=1 Tax=Nocardioides sp. TaxID=35761 RepID=UPI0039E4F25E